MALEPGTRFGAYEIVGEIGAGGMGVVHRARDTKLDREVAIKVLPASMADDAERLTRFDREAKTLASLNHTNIGQIYGLEESEGTTALILELVEGPTLADRLEQGPLSADETMRIAMQIAAALEAAHGQGIVHRDLKPANVKLKPDGTVKVLDFGIAKAMQPDVLTSAPQSPILTTPATQVGVILGTAAYMSPEQAKGKFVDQRTDIWAFGCLLFEMLTGQMAFGAEDVPTTLARVIDRETDLDSLPGAISPAVRQTIQLCLRKDASKRVADIRDVRLALAGELDTGSPDVAETAAIARPLWRRALPIAAALVAGGILVGIAGDMLRREPEPPAVTRFAYELSDDQAFRFPGWPMMAVSPDGRRFVYNTEGGLYVREMDDLEARLISGTDIDPILVAPTFSPDGQMLAYGEGGQLKRIAISGGAPVTIGSSTTNIYGISWEQDGTLLYVDTEGVYRVRANGGMAELVVAREDDGSVGFHGVDLLPDGDSILFSTINVADWDAGQIVVHSISTGERTVLIEGGSDARYLPTGHIVYALGGTLFAVAFDPDTLTVSGGTVPVVQGVLRSTTGESGVAHYGVSENGALIYVTGSISPIARALVWVDREGREELIDMPPRAYTSPRLSPDGTRVALNPRDQETDIWVWDLAREALTRLTFDAALERFPAWSPDSLRIAYNWGRSGATDEVLMWRAADGSGSPEQLARSDGEIYPTSFLPDGSAVLVYGDFAGANANEDIAIVQLDGDDEAPILLLQTPFSEVSPDVSPDGAWLAYASNESGRLEVYVRAFPDVDTGGRWQVSTDGGTTPLWSRDGQTLFYRNNDAMMAVSVQTEPTFVAGTPELVFEGRYAAPLGGRTFDVTADGERFLMLKEVGDSSEAPQILVVQNWFEELERLVPKE